MAEIKAVALDVDGVLTDGTFWWGPDDQEWKRFSFRDIMGMARASRTGLILCLISGEESPLVDRVAHKLGIEHVFKGCRDKAAALREFARRSSLRLEEIAFMGDDINDVEAMQAAGFAAAPADAHVSARQQARWVTTCAGGHGAVRELMDHLAARSFQA
jgi:3-deoxy-D-manno-octulosonate 8-phosphate phosphatase (KDO 8-P phosphatase)